MKMHRAVLDIAGRLVHLDSPVCGKVILHLPMISHIKASLHHVVEMKLEDIHVVRDFLDVFLDDLLGMPPERAIEFKIDLQPGTTPIAKAPYKMSHVELKEMKINLGVFSVVCREKGQRATSICGLLTAQCSHYQ
jgi:hypothetical protein